MSIKNKYKTVEQPDNITVAIEITKGPFKGIVYRYGKISVDEGKKEDLILSFNYDIIENKQSADVNSKKLAPKFEKFLGDVIVDILINEVKKNGEIKFENTKNRVSNSKKSNNE